MTTTNITVGPLAQDEVPAAKDLFDRAFGAGFEEIDATNMAFAAHLGSRLVGVLTAAPRRPADLESHYAGRVSWPGDSRTHDEVVLIRQIAVEQDARKMGVGDALMTAAEDAVAGHGADLSRGRTGFLVANAWVHANTGHCPAAPLLERSGFEAVGWCSDFFAEMPSEDCPGCGEAPCCCSVRVYFKHLGRSG
jgi:GNAT superfamily N-acetyltransferase